MVFPFGAQPKMQIFPPRFIHGMAASSAGGYPVQSIRMSTPSVRQDTSGSEKGLRVASSSGLWTLYSGAFGGVNKKGIKFSLVGC